MNDLVIYIAKATAITSAFYLLYRFTLRRETFHRLNRIFLNVSLLISFAIPFCVISEHITIVNETLIEPIQEMTNAVTPSLETATKNGVSETDEISILAFMLLTGAVCVAVYTVICTVRLRVLLKHIASQSRIIRHEDGTKLYITSEKLAPFSWFKSIVISEKDYQNNAEVIIAHERSHSQLNHSLDILLINLCCAIQWFNPLIWLLRKDLKSIHEYQADNSVLSQGFNAKYYQLLLINKAAGNKSHSIANSLNHSTLKNRITMMLSKKSTRMSRCKLLVALPLAAISLTLFAQRETVAIEFNQSLKDTTISAFDKKSQKISSILGTGTIRGIYGEYGKNQHSGIDIATEKDAPVYSLMNGVVKVAEYDKKGKGNRIVIAHENNIESEYCHLASMGVQQGQQVTSGDQIGIVGNTGKATGIHLHFEVRENGKAINPEPYLPVSRPKE